MLDRAGDVNPEEAGAHLPEQLMFDTLHTLPREFQEMFKNNQGSHKVSRRT